MSEGYQLDPRQNQYDPRLAASLGNGPTPTEARPLALALDRTEKAIQVLDASVKRLAERLRPSLTGASGGAQRGGPETAPAIGISPYVQRIVNQGDQISAITEIVRLLHEQTEL